ncbi:uncharacterized protein SAPINGB_P001312 [Magnusiomyces paraingens]|uniref:Arginase n=1 Tax=Magnusiomyces paraingens TaxID=2606893 RepID=A0A5E8B5M8_9ASCO|nr:uncharacterized protein SAPINGB_P001312 [Saprochaete ingens]VVT46636.1 unnamed protein product [Saprochaete ingens]
MSFDERFPKRQVQIISAPFSGGQPRGGVDEGPQHLLEAGLETVLKDLDWNPSFDGHLDFPVPESGDEPIGHVKNPRHVSSAAHKVFTHVSEAAKSGKFPLTIGGDHSIGIGTVAGVMQQYPDACVIWVDAHADINSPQGSESGNLHGCPVSFVLGHDDPLPSDDPKEANLFNWVPHCLDPSRIAYIGLRDLDKYEKNILKENHIAAFTMRHVDQYGIGKVVEMALRAINPHNKRPIHLSFDIDALDPFFAPATGTAVRGGLTWREGCYICEAIAETGNLVAMDLVEVNPHLAETEEHAKMTTNAGISLVKCALGDVLL